MTKAVTVAETAMTVANDKDGNSGRDGNDGSK
jgi:hypothetical protein